MKNITFDLETLGNTSNAPITQIAAVEFNEEGEILQTFSRNIKIESLERYNFTVDFSTLQFWFEQKDEAIKAVFCQGGIDIRQALFEFIGWLEKPSEYVYWSHATFDPPILNNNFKKVGLNNPIPFRAHRDIRTLVHFAGHDEVKTDDLISHVALDDCIKQARYIAAGLKKCLSRQYLC